jgi:MFS family permease
MPARSSTELSRRLVYALLALTTAQAAVYVARPVTSYRLLSLGAGPREIGLVAAAFALLPLFLAIPFGRFADRRHDGPLLVGGCGAQILGCLWLAAARSPLGMAAASTLLGVGHLGLALGAQAVIARESRPSRHDQHFGLLAAGVSLGQLVGPLVGGFVLGNRHGGALTAATGHALIVGAAIAAVALVCALLAQRGAPPRPSAASDGAAPASVVGVLRTRGVAAAIFASIAVLSAADVFTAYLPVLADQRHIEPRVVGILLAVRAAASMASRIGIGPIVGRVGRVRLITISSVAAAVALVGMAYTGDVVLLALLSAAAGLGLGFGQPLSMTIVVQLVPESVRGTALAVRLTGNRVGQVAAPAAAGLVAGSSGTASVFWMLAAMLVASGVAVQRSGERQDVGGDPLLSDEGELILPAEARRE